MSYGFDAKNLGKSQEAYSCFITRFERKPIYIIQTVPNVTEQFKELDGAISTELLLAITKT